MFISIVFEHHFQAILTRQRQSLNVSLYLSQLAKAYSTIAFVTKRVDYAEKAQRSAAVGSPTSAFCSMVRVVACLDCFSRRRK